MGLKRNEAKQLKRWKDSKVYFGKNRKHNSEAIRVNSSGIEATKEY